MAGDLDPLLSAEPRSGLEPLLPSAASLQERIALLRTALDERPRPTAGWAAAVPLLARALSGRDTKAACAAVQVLGRIGAETEGVVPALVRTALRRPSARTPAAGRWRIGHLAQLAAEELLRMGGAAVPTLIEALAGPDAEPVLKAAELLGDFGAAAEPAVPALLAAARRRDIRAAHTAGAAVRRIRALCAGRRADDDDDDAVDIL